MKKRKKRKTEMLQRMKLRFSTLKQIRKKSDKKQTKKVKKKIPRFF